MIQASMGLRNQFILFHKYRKYQIFILQCIEIMQLQTFYKVFTQAFDETLLAHVLIKFIEFNITFEISLSICLKKSGEINISKSNLCFTC